MPLKIIRADISKVRADAIVNTANPEVAVGAGVDEAIYKAAGWEKLLAERAKIGPMEPGQAAATPAFGLRAKYIIHTVGPAWRGGDYKERETVASCYRESLRIADELNCETVAFPLISTGTYGFPKDDALKIATSEISSFLFEHEMTVYMVVYDRESFVLSGKAFADIRTFIEEKDVKPRVMYGGRAQYLNVPESSAYVSHRRKKSEHYAPEPLEKEVVYEASTAPKEDWYEDVAEAPKPAPTMESYTIGAGAFKELEKELDKIVTPRNETFQEMLFRHIDRKGLTNPQVYKRANMDRKHFSKIQSDRLYRPKKNTALALAVALRLNLDETIDLLQRAGYALSPSIVSDLIVQYCIEHGIYDIFEINNYLFDYEQPVLA